MKSPWPSYGAQNDSNQDCFYGLVQAHFFLLLRVSANLIRGKC